MRPLTLPMNIARLVMLACLVLCAGGARAGSLEIPLHVPLEPIRDALRTQLAAAADKPEVIYQEGPCRYLHYAAPRLEAHDGQLRFVGSGAAALGGELFDTCYNAASWHGSMEFTLAPQLDSAGRLSLRIVNSRLTDASGKETPTLGFIWDLTKSYLNPRLEKFSYDIGASRETLLAVLRTAAPPAHSAELEQALAHVHVLEPRVAEQDIVVPISIDIPDAWQTAPQPATAPVAPLTETELVALEQTLQPWDAFLVYSIKQIAIDSPDGALHKKLFDLLLDSRYRLVDILSGEQRGNGDPLREQFIATWNDLSAILADAQHAGLLDASVLRYAAFINAGDALTALDHAAPGLGMQISTDGLRRLARSLRPDAVGDPLAYDWNVDPQLQKLFDTETIPEPAPAPAPASAPAPAPATTSPPTPGQSLLELLIPVAHADSDQPALDRWVPKPDELAAYQARMATLLQQTAGDELQRSAVGSPYDKMFLNMIPTTAMIESCWHQYVSSNGKVSYLRSQAGSIGIMQINQLVWRGFYNIERLKWDTAYNARAGAQILMRYLKDYAIDYADRSGNPDHVPRAMYAVYNAGPRAVGRFNKPHPPARQERVDQRLWTLYQGIAAGGQVDLGTCSVKTAAATP
jgi:hypothetical protein